MSDLVIKEDESIIINKISNKSNDNHNYLFLDVTNNKNEFIESFDIVLSDITINTKVDLVPNERKIVSFSVDNLEFKSINIDNIKTKEYIVKSNTLDMTKGNIKSIILRFALPIFLSSLFQQLYNTIDSLIVGKFVGKEALAAVSSSGNLIHLFTSFFLGTAMGSGVLISKFFGAKDYKKMSKAIHNNIALGIVSSVLLTIIGVLLSPVILKWMRIDSDVLPNSIEYFKYYFLGCTAIIMYNILSSTLNAVGNSKRSLVYLIISSCLNVILDLFFIAYLGGSVKEAAIATTISQFVSVILCLIHMFKKKNIYHIEIKKICFDKEMLMGVLKYGLPSGIQNSVIGLANVIVQSNINVFGASATAGCGSYSKVEGFAFLPVNSFTMAISTFISQNLGAHEFERAKKGARFGIISSITIAELIGLIIFIFAPTLIGLFSDEKEVIEYGTNYSRTTSLFFFLLSYSHCVAAVCRGSGKAIVPMIIMLSVWCILRVTYISIIMSFTDDIQNVFIAYPLTWGISSIIYFIYYYKSDWIHNFEIEKTHKYTHTVHMSKFNK